MKKTFLALMFFLTSLAHAQTGTYVAEHCLPAYEGSIACFKQVVDESGNSRFIVTEDSWAKVVSNPILASTDITFEIEGDETVDALEPALVLGYAYPTAGASDVSPLDAVRVIYKNPRKCGCIGSVLTGAIIGGAGGVEVGGTVGLLFTPAGAAAGAAVLGTAGAIGGGLVGYQECKDSRKSKKDCGVR